MRPESFQIDGEIHSDGVVRTAESFTWIVGYLAFANLWTALLVSIPVSTDVGPNNYYANHPEWYTGDDVMRFIEPVGGVLVNSLIFYHSGIFASPLNEASMAMVGVYLFGCALYLQGGATHAAANMIKNAMKTISNGRDDDYYDPLYYYIRTVWEHGVAHYIYAAGLAIMHGMQAFAYRNIRAPEAGLSVKGRALLTVSSGTLAFLAFVVALQFPAGTIVGFIYLLLYGMCAVGGYLLHLYRRGEKKALTSFGHLPVLHHFFAAYVLAFIALIGWIIHRRGFVSRSSE